MEQTLLVAEDTSLMREHYERMLKAAPWQRVYAENGRDATAMLEQLVSEGKTVVVLTDMSMPVMNGFQLLKYVTNTHPEVPVIMASTHPAETYSAVAMKGGAVAYLCKTSNDFSAEKIMETVTSAFEKARKK